MESGARHYSLCLNCLSAGGFEFEHLNYCLNIAVCKRERLLSALIGVDARHVVRHQHSVVADFLISPGGLEHVHIAIVGESLREIEKASADIPEVHIEYPLPTAEITDDIVDLLVGIL